MSDGKLSQYGIREYNSDGKLIKASGYDPEGVLQTYAIYKYDDNGVYCGWEQYDGEGNLTYSTIK